MAAKQLLPGLPGKAASLPERTSKSSWYSACVTILPW